MATVTHDGKNPTISITSPISFGDVVVYPTFIAVSQATVTAEDLTRLGGSANVAIWWGHSDTKRFSMPSKTADTFAIGTVVYWDATNKELTTTSTGKAKAGISMTVKSAVAGNIDCVLTVQ